MIKTARAIVCASTLIFGFGGVAASKAGPVEDVVGCSDIVSDIERLACYDASVGQMKAAGITTEQVYVPTPKVVQPSSAVAVAANSEKDGGLMSRFGLPAILKSGPKKESDFGREQVTKNSDGEIQSIRLKVKSHKFNPYGYITVTLENGQVWRQTSGSKPFVPKSGDLFAVIRTGAVSGYRMKLNDSGASIIVERVK